ncbi:MAG: cell wall hydrolase [Pseudomonadota bacterium]
MTRERFTFGHKPIFKSPPEAISAADGQTKAHAASSSLPAEGHIPTPRTIQTNRQAWLAEQPSSQKPAGQWSLKRRLAAILAVIAVPAMAAPADFGRLPGSAPTEAELVRERLQEELARNPAMPFERPGMSFPGSAFFFLDEPPSDALIALPEADALAEGVGEAGREVGASIDAGPGANPFFTAGGASHARAASCLAQAIWYEAASESEAGQRAVAQVVLNRVAHPNWPGSVCGVVYQGSKRRTGCQFTFTCDGSLRRTAGGRSWQRAQDIASEALSGSVYAPIGHATHYHTLWVTPYWASSLDHVGTVGAHRFYRNRGAGGRKDAFTQSYAGVEPGVRRPVTAHPVLDRAPLRGTGTAPRRASAEYAPNGPVYNGESSSSVHAPSTAVPRTGPGSVRSDHSITAAGQIRQDYAQAGQWKSDAARAALIEDERQRAHAMAEQSVEKE